MRGFEGKVRGYDVAGGRGLHEPEESRLECSRCKQSYQSMDACSQVKSIEQPSCIEQQLFL